MDIEQMDIEVGFPALELIENDVILSSDLLLLRSVKYRINLQ